MGNNAQSRDQSLLYDETVKKKILVVDDDQDIQLLLARTLGNKYTVLLASNGVDALDILQNEKPDLITLDYEMPIMNGPEFLEARRGDHLHIPVILISAIGSDDMVDTLDIKANLPKPTDRNLLLETVEKFLS